MTNLIIIYDEQESEEILDLNYTGKVINTLREEEIHYVNGVRTHIKKLNIIED